MWARRAIGAFFATYDIWLTPTTAQTRPKLGFYNMNIDLPPAEFITREESTQQFMVPYNVTGQPAISLPLGMHSNGLPIGVQLGARPGEDHLLIELGGEVCGEVGRGLRDSRRNGHGLGYVREDVGNSVNVAGEATGRRLCVGWAPRAHQAVANATTVFAQ